MARGARWRHRVRRRELRLLLVEVGHFLYVLTTLRPYVYLSTRATARVAGLCYLIVVVLGGFAELVVRRTVYLAGDAAAYAASTTGTSSRALSSPLWLVPLGLLVLRSRLFRRALGFLPIIGCVGYLVATFSIILAPELGELMDEVVTVPGAIAEVWMMLYLLTIGVRPRP